MRAEWKRLHKVAICACGGPYSYMCDCTHFDVYYRTNSERITREEFEDGEEWPGFMYVDVEASSE